jgi:hypothetical protein
MVAKWSITDVMILAVVRRGAAKTAAFTDAMRNMWSSTVAQIICDGLEALRPASAFQR